MKTFLIVLFLFLIHIYLCQSFSEDIDDWEESEQIRIRAKDIRKYIQTKEELELTKEPPIIDPQPCDDMHPISVFIHSAGRSSGKYFERRQAVRNTWVSQMKELGISAYFAIALNPKQTVNEELKKESDRYQDIIQFQFIDAYYNLTLKAISILRWIDRKCQNSTHILKTDDDVIVNIPYILDKLSDLKPGFSGDLLSKSKVLRDPKSRVKFLNSIFLNSYQIFRQMVYSLRVFPKRDVSQLRERSGIFYESKHNTISTECIPLLFWLCITFGRCLYHWYYSWNGWNSQI